MTNIEVERMIRKDERNWLLTISGINKGSAEGIALSKSEDYYTHVVYYNPDDPDHGYAVYQYWRHYGLEDKENGLPEIVESEEFKVKRLKLAIERRIQKLQNHKEYIAKYQQELINLVVCDKT